MDVVSQHDINVFEMKTFLVNVKDRRRRAEQFIQTCFYGLGGPDELSTSLRLCKLQSENSLQDRQKGIAMNAQLQESSSNRGYQQHFTIITKNNAAVTGFYLGHVHNGKNKILQPCNQEERLQDCISCVMN